MFSLTACGSFAPPAIPIVTNPLPPVVVPQPIPQPVPVPVPVPVPNMQFHIGEIVFVRNTYGMICRGQIVNIMNDAVYMLNPVVCNHHTYFYNVTVNVTALYR